MEDANPPPAWVLCSIDQIQFALLYIFSYSHINHIVNAIHRRISATTIHNPCRVNQFLSTSERTQNQPLQRTIFFQQKGKFLSSLRYFIPLENPLNQGLNRSEYRDSSVAMDLREGRSWWSEYIMEWITKSLSRETWLGPLLSRSPLQLLEEESSEVSNINI